MTMRVLGTALALALCASVLVATPALAAPPAHPADTVLVETAHSGGHYAATNTTSAGGGIYEDVPLTTSAGQLVCASAWLRDPVAQHRRRGQVHAVAHRHLGDQRRGHRLRRAGQPR